MVGGAPSGSWCTRNGRPLRSTAAVTRVSSIGTVASPYRRTPALSPRGFGDSPRRKQMPTSSTVWWASMCRSPSQATARSNRPCFAQVGEHVVEEPDPGVSRLRGARGRRGRATGRSSSRGSRARCSRYGACWSCRDLFAGRRAARYGTSPSRRRCRWTAQPSRPVPGLADRARRGSNRPCHAARRIEAKRVRRARSWRCRISVQAGPLERQPVGRYGRGSARSSATAGQQRRSACSRATRATAWVTAGQMIRAGARCRRRVDDGRRHSEVAPTGPQARARP